MWKALILLLVTGVVALVLLVSDQFWVEQPRPPAPLPAAVVTLGDSTLSGEGGGNYQQGTNGENNNWCHRSPAAPLYQLDLPGSVARINLACSGAQAKLLGLQPSPEHAEGSQAQRLAEVAKHYRITDIVVQAGANDDPGFTDVVNRCVSAWASRSTAGCSKDLRASWPQRVDQMRPKVAAGLQDVRLVMERAGYKPDSYSLTLQSYASPVSPQISPELQNLSGCPFVTEDLAWLRDTAIPELSEGLRKVAQESGARFLDLSRAGRGHEACTGDPRSPEKEWFTRLTVDWEALQSEQRAPHAMQESFHANVAGHRELGRCLSEFLSSRAPHAACLADDRDSLHAVPDEVAARHP
jgi:hypothetical protein